MLRCIMAGGLALGICCTITLAGETKITDIKKIPLEDGKTIEVLVEGTNKLETGETFNGWTPSMMKPNGQVVPVTILQFAPPVPGGNPVKFQYRYVVTNPQDDKGDWWARSSLGWKDPKGGGNHNVEKKVPIP